MGERDGEYFQGGGHAPVAVGDYGAMRADGLPPANPIAEAIAKARKPAKTPKKAGAAGLPRGFKLDGEGLWFTEEKTGEDGEAKPGKVWVCAPLRVTAETRSADQNQWGRLLEWQDRDGHPHQWAIPMSLLEGEPTAFCAVLADGGLLIGSSAKVKRLLVRYVKDCAPGVKARCVARIGWHNGVYVLPQRSIGDAGGERVLFQTGDSGLGDFRQRGTAADWRESVGRLCAGNSRLVLAVGFAFAAPLLDMAGEESGGAHFRGDSSCGKSTALWAAASVYGPPEGDHAFRKEWRATGNGLEGLATSRNDSLLILDEMGQVDGREAGAIAYMLANGQPKLRMSDNITLRKLPSWRLLFLSTGEISLADHMAAAGKKIKAGQENRLADIPADAGAGLGMFDRLNGQPGGAALSVAIREAAARHYGAVGLAFIEQAARWRGALPDRLKAFAARFAAEVLPPGASGQVHRVARRFALVAAALELAGEWGLTGWPEGDGTAAVKACFADWLKQRGGAGNQEEAAILAQVRRFFEAHGESRFSDWQEKPTENGGTVQLDGARPTLARVGFKRRTGGGFTYYVLPESFKTEICAGLSADKAAQVLKERGWIEPDGQGKTQQKPRLPGFGKPTRCYVFTSKMWE